MKSLLSVVLLAVSAAFSAPEPKVSFRFDPEGFRGDSTRMLVRVSLPEGWHIQSNAPADSFLIPTTVSASGEGLIFGKPVYPAAKAEDFPDLGGKVMLFEGEILVRVPVKRKNAKIGAAALHAAAVKLHYQACNNTQCLPPRDVVGQYAPVASHRIGPAVK